MCSTKLPKRVMLRYVGYPLGKYTVHLRLIEKHVVDFVLIELFAIRVYVVLRLRRYERILIRNWRF